MEGNSLNYKQKYQELKMKYMQDVDVAFRLGFEQGQVQGQQDAQMQAQQHQQEQMNAQQGSIQEGHGSIGSPAGAEQQANPNGGQIGDMEPDSENPAGSELDQHIEKLESMLKSEQSNPADLILLTSKIQNLRKSMKEAIELRKSAKAIPAIAKALHKPAFKIGVQASHNLTNNAKQAVNMQEKIVSDLMKAMADEEVKATKSIKSILAVESLTKKE